MKILLIVVLAAMTTVNSSSEEAVPVNKEPRHKMVLSNEYVEVMRVTLQPGESTVLHTHSHDGVAVRLSDTKVRVDVPGKPSTESEVHPGQVSAQAYGKSPFTHRVNCVGTSTFDVVDVEILKRASGAEVPAFRQPDAENDSARVYRWELAPGDSTPQHKHERPYLVIAVTLMELKMSGPGAPSLSHHVNIGDFHWVDTKVEHSLKNDGKEKGTIVEVELK
jgi:quercetin dioxygenase-like cupin family protein